MNRPCYFDADCEQLEGAVLDGAELRIEDEDRLLGVLHGHDIASHGGESVRRERKLWTGRPSSVQVAGLALGDLGALRLGDDGGPYGVGRGLS